jgi:hypothetical protein
MISRGIDGSVGEDDEEEENDDIHEEKPVNSKVRKKIPT